MSTDQTTIEIIMIDTPSLPIQKVAIAREKLVFVKAAAFIIGAMLLFSEAWSSTSTNMNILPYVRLIFNQNSFSDTYEGNSFPSTDEGDRSFNLMELQLVDHVDSPFEEIWPDSTLPGWAKKHVNYEVPSGQNVCFVHVGKAGGSTIGCSLGFSLHCGETVQTNGILPKVTTHVFHKDVYNCPDDSAYFLFVVRDPIERARSAFNYDRPGDDCDDDYISRMNEFYFNCPFFYFEDYVQNGLSDGVASKRCKGMAEVAIKGELPTFGPSHLYYNYQYYYEAVPNDASIIVIRNEHIEEDWNSVSDMLGDREDILSQNHFPRGNANTWSSEEDMYLSEDSIAILCHSLCNEIQQYKKILRQAQNLNAQQLRVSLAELEKKCPIGDTCSQKLPKIDSKLERNRGYIYHE